MAPRRWELGPPCLTASSEPVADLEPDEKRGCAFPLCHLLGITHVENLAIGPQREYNTQTLE